MPLITVEGCMPNPLLPTLVVAYIYIYFFPQVIPFDKQVILDYHRIVSLYGWNLSGLAVICRFNDFPISLHSGRTIFLHWLVVLVLAPLGNHSVVIAIFAVIAYALFLYSMFFTSGGQIMPSFDRSNTA